MQFSQWRVLLFVLYLIRDNPWTMYLNILFFYKFQIKLNSSVRVCVTWISLGLILSPGMHLTLSRTTVTQKHQQQNRRTKQPKQNEHNNKITKPSNKIIWPNDKTNKTTKQHKTIQQSNRTKLPYKTRKQNNTTDYTKKHQTKRYNKTTQQNITTKQHYNKKIKKIK